MTVKEYLHQAYRLDQRIKSDTMEAQNLREMAGSVSAIQYDKWGLRQGLQTNTVCRSLETTRSPCPDGTACLISEKRYPSERY